jgi:hypothetical protein
LYKKDSNSKAMIAEEVAKCEAKCTADGKKHETGSCIKC